ncbi:MAG TPA: ABC transporter permease [Acidobacteriota bacterium]|nr:ABC transporter permease [Acidobacteriota bacterium]
MSRPQGVLGRLLLRVVPQHGFAASLVGDLDEIRARETRTFGYARAAARHARRVASVLLHFGRARLGGNATQAEGGPGGDLGLARRPGGDDAGLGSGRRTPGGWGRGLAQDLRVAVRQWARSPLAALVVMLTLAIGIGANTAIFSVVNSVLVRPLPYPEAGQLVVVHTELQEQGETVPASSPPEFQDLLDHADAFASLGAMWYRPAALTDDGVEPEDIDVAFVSAGLLPTLGVEPLLGRFPRPEEDLDRSRVVLLAHETWQRRYGGDPDLVGRTIEFDGVARTVVGVMPADFRMLFPPDIHMPPRVAAWMTWGGSYDEYPRRWRVMTVVGRLQPQLSAAAATAELRGVADQVRSDHADDYAGSGYDLRIEQLADDLVAHVRPTLVLLLAAVGFVLLIACANVANFMLGRSVNASRELAIRGALGASGWRLLRQLVTESAVITFAGAGLGLVLARWGIRTLPLLAPADLPRLEAVGIDGPVLLFTCLVAIGTSLVFGSAMAMQLRSRGRAAVLKEGARALTGAGSERVRSALVMGQIALSLMLLVGAGLVVRSFALLSQVDPGFESSDVLTMKLSLVDAHYPYSEPAKIAEFYRQLVSRVGELAAVGAVGATTQLPLDGSRYSLAPYAYEAEAGVVEWNSIAADYRTVTAGWLEAMGARLVEGRTIARTDDLDTARVVVIDEILARQAWPGTSAVGQRLQVEVFLAGERYSEWAEVVGVVEHLRHQPGTLGSEQVYIAHAQAPQRTMALTIRTDADARSLVESVRGIVHELDADQPLQRVRPLSEYLGESIAPLRFALTLLGAFAVVALVLATLGVYGIVSYGVTQRTREIGIRMAIGASPTAVVRAVVGRTAVLAATGVALGLLGALALSQFMSGLLFGVAPTDPVVFGAVAVLFTAVALGACYLPARGASRLAPASALRRE